MPDQTLLLVDDEPNVLGTMVRVLARSGRYHLMQAGSYEEAFREIAACDRTIDLAILDVALQGKNGIQLAVDLQILFPEIKVLFVSGLAGAELLQYSGISPTDAVFLRKPFRSSHLVQRVEEALSASARNWKSVGSSGSA